MKQARTDIDRQREDGGVEGEGDDAHRKRQPRGTRGTGIGCGAPGWAVSTIDLCMRHKPLPAGENVFSVNATAA